MKKLMNKKAFTLMEMLIVVAIIAVLVAIAIPTFTAQLEKAKESADVANIRAAYASLQVAILSDDAALPKDESSFWSTYGGGATLNYNTGATEGSGDNKFTYTTPTGTAGTQVSTTITYKPNKINDKKAYTWTVTGKMPTA